MKRTLTATVVNGGLQMDEPLDLPDHSRVEVTIEAESTRTSEPAVPEGAADSGVVTADRQKRRDAFERFRKLTEEHPFNSGGVRFTREELNERD